MSDIDNTDDNISNASIQSDAGKLRTCTGLLRSYHGVAYQIQWLMVVAIEAKKRRKVHGFRFRTEVDYEDSGKFDDVVWEYYCDQEEKFKYNFLQAKHKLNEEHDIITIRDLENRNGPFGLKKYYVSYKESIQHNNKYKNGTLENLILATNIDLDHNLKRIFKTSQIHIPLLNTFESEECGHPKCWQIDPSAKEHIASILVILEDTYDLIKLAKMLEDIIFNNKEFIIPNDLQEYSIAICENLLNIDGTKISSDFIDNKNLSCETSFLRQAFLNVAFVEKRNFDERDIRCFRETVGYDNIDDFALFIASKINEARYKNKLVKIRLPKNSKCYENYKQNISRLANFVLIKHNGIKFNPKFWIQNENDLSQYFKILKIKLKCNLIDCGLIGRDDTNKEIFMKLDPYRFQISNFTTCMMHLTDENTFWDIVRGYSTKLTITSRQCGKALPNYSLLTVREDINIFFSKLVFAVNFTKTILKEAVKDYFDENFIWIDSEFTAYAFRSEIANALDLTQNKFISNADEVTQFFNKVEHETNRLILIGPTIEYCTKIELYDIEFHSDIINVPSLNCFINRGVKKLKDEHCNKVYEYDHFCSKQVLCYISNQILLSSIKVYNLLKNSVKYSSQKNYIFMRLESVIYLNEHVMQVFEKSVSLLVIECDLSSTFDLRKICKKIISILRSDTTKKVILITKGNNYLKNQLKNEFDSSYCEIVDPEVHFCNLKEKTQKKLLQNYKIFFQGKEISIGDLIKDFEILIDSQILCHFLNNDKIEVCNRFLNKDNIINFYISREISCLKKVSTKVFKENSADLYALSNIKLNDLIDIAMLYNKSDSNITSKITEFDKVNLNDLSIVKFIKVDNELQYTLLCEASKHTNVHWLVKEKNYFKWKGTKGSLSNLRPYMTLRKYYSDSEIVTKLKNDRIVIIAADPGMGKSTLITHLALKLKDEFPLLWVLVIDLRKFRTELKKIKINNGESVINFLVTVVDFKILNEIKICDKIINWFTKQLDTKHFIYEMKVKGTDLLEMIVFYNKLHVSGELYIFLDGFDEICPKYAAEVTYVIKYLQHNSLAHIWTTCRTYNIINTLEDNLKIVSYGMKSFSKIDQEMFLLKYWQSQLKFDTLHEHRAKIYIDALLDEFSKATNDTKRTFVGIPLQIKMLAQNRLNMFKEFYESGVLSLNDEDKIKIKKGLNLVNLYDEFIDVKFREIRFKEKKNTWPSDDEDIERMIEKCRQKFIYEHQVLSIYALYAERKELCSENIKSEALSLLPKIRVAEDKNAVICGVVNENPIFVHQTYAEYFASLFLWNKFQSASLEDFRISILPNISNGIFFSDERLQVCKFFYYMADKYLNENVHRIYAANEDIKIASTLQELSGIIYAIYDSYENQGIFSKGIDDVKIINYTMTGYNIESVFKQNPQFAQVAKLMFYVVESYLTVNKSDHVINTNLKKNNSIHLLQMASEIGCLNFVKTFLSVKDDYNTYKNVLRHSKWYFSPVWLAARNGHLDVLKQLSFVINQEWPDKDDKTLTQRAYNLPECDVLQNCLLLNIIDANPYSDLNNIQILPIVNALQNVWPLNVIEILIEKTDSDIFNNFVCNENQLKASLAVCTSLLKYEKSVVISMINKGMNFFGALNILLFEFTFTSLYEPIQAIKYARFYGPSFHSEQEYLQVYRLIETFLHTGVGFNSLDDVHSVTTLEYCKQAYYMHQLFLYLADYKVEQIDGVYLLLMLILEALTDKCEIIKWSDTSLLLKVRKLKCSTAKKEKTYTALECCNKTLPKSYNCMIIELVPITENNFLSCLDKPTEVIENTLANVTKYMAKASQEIKEFRKYPDSKLYNNIFIAYEEMLQYRFMNDVSKRSLFQSLSTLERYIFQCVLNLYIRQDYDINEAFTEVKRNLWRYKMIRTWLQEKPNRSNISIKEIIKIFDLDLSSETNESIIMKNKIMTIIINIFNTGALHLLLKVWNELNFIGFIIYQKVIKSMAKYEHISKNIFDLFSLLNVYYVRLINAVKSGKSEKLLEVLKNIDSAFIKSVVNAQDSEYGSPLHYAVFVGNVETVRTLVAHSADPNQELQFNCKFLVDTEDSAGITPQDIAQKREHLNPEVYKTIGEILGNLRIS